jgi:hypothetical protein
VVELLPSTSVQNPNTTTKERKERKKERIQKKARGLEVWLKW